MLFERLDLVEVPHLMLADHADPLPQVHRPKQAMCIAKSGQIELPAALGFVEEAASAIYGGGTTPRPGPSPPAAPHSVELSAYRFCRCPDTPPRSSGPAQGA